MGKDHNVAKFENITFEILKLYEELIIKCLINDKNKSSLKGSYIIDDQDILY